MIGELITAVEATQIAAFFRTSRWGYAALNATHIFAIALLVGNVLALNLRLIGLWPALVRPQLAQLLVPLAGAGLGLALLTGGLLFSVRANEYASLTIFQIKMALVAIGSVSAVIAHARYGLWFTRTDKARLSGVAVVSLTCWLGALMLGRLIAFAA